ncbi:putative carboxylesterase 17 [Morus notabilis]|uniref:Putative carboxylesterase 17 n=1 Tax=Morus notabilis TaxID=981085 RepID=W9RM60_9ROSA|nr:putative carboxylesterase 17 [Morus notabilis]
MATISMDTQLNHIPAAPNKNHHQHGSAATVEEIEGLIRVSKDGHVERPAIIPNVPSTWSIDKNLVMSKDVFIDKLTNLWARIYVPNYYYPNDHSLPLLVYFHGGGFCVGSAAWSCYHEFLANLATTTGCVVVSVNYRLAPENRLPTAYDDGFNAIMWIKQQATGDSAGANIAYHVSNRLSCNNAVLRPLRLKGLARTGSEKSSTQPPNSVLTLSASDTYWRLSLPSGSSRDHPWCNPLAGGVARLRDLRVPATMVCVAEMDILRDRNLEFCNALVGAGKKVETTMYRGVGHAFQILHNSQSSRAQTQEMMSHIKSFINQ